MKTKIKIDELYCYLLYVSLFKLCFLPETIQLSIKALCLILSFVFFIQKVKKKNLFNAIILISVSCFISSMISHNLATLSTQKTIKSMVYGLSLYTIYLMVRYFQTSGGYVTLIRYLCNITKVYCLLSIVSVLISGTTKSGVETYYWFGTKFMTSYLFLFWLMLYRLINVEKINKNQRDKFIYLLFSIAVILFIYYLNCGTTFLASIFLFVDQFFSDRIRDFLKKPVMVLTSMCLAGMFPYIYNLILSNSYVQKVFFIFLGKSSTLTGRTVIYDKLVYIISNRPIWGYGYQNEAVKYFVSENFGNVQNAIAQWTVDYGIIGLIILFFYSFYCLRRASRNDYLNGWYTILYAFIICSTVEVSFNFFFFIALVVIGVFKDSKKQVI